MTIQSRASLALVLKGLRSITSFWQGQELELDLSRSLPALFSRVYQICLLEAIPMGKEVILEAFKPGKSSFFLIVFFLGALFPLVSLITHNSRAFPSVGRHCNPPPTPNHLRPWSLQGPNTAETSTSPPALLELSPQVKSWGRKKREMGSFTHRSLPQKTRVKNTTTAVRRRLLRCPISTQEVMCQRMPGTWSPTAVEGLLW